MKQKLGYEGSADQIWCAECTCVSDKHSIIGVENKITTFEILGQSHNLRLSMGDCIQPCGCVFESERFSSVGGDSGGSRADSELQGSG